MPKEFLSFSSSVSLSSTAFMVRNSSFSSMKGSSVTHSHGMALPFGSTATA